MNQLIIDTGKVGGIISRHLYGHFAGSLGTGIYGGLWVGEDSPIPNTRGLRNDVVAALKKIAVPNIRWPGGGYAETYHWRDGVGPRAQRPITGNGWSGGVTENNHFGTHEFMDLCGQVGAEPCLGGNLGSGTVQEMADWLAYLTTPASSPLSQPRRDHGRQLPWPIKYWAVGNENWGCGGHMKAEHYAWEFRRYQTFCKNHSGGKLYKVACGHEDAWNDIVLGAAHDYMDGLSIPHGRRIGQWGKDGAPTDFTFDPAGGDVCFAEKQWWQTMRLASDLDQFIRRTLVIMDRYDPEHRIGLIMNEWGAGQLEPKDRPPGATLYQQNTLRDALVAGLTLNILHSHADRMPLANSAQMVNGLQAMIFTDGPRILLTPAYHVFEMNRVHHDAALLPSELKCAEAAPMPAISASASRDAAGKIHLAITHLHPTKAAPLQCELPGMSLGGRTRISGRILTAGTMDAHNSFAAPSAVVPQPFTDFRVSSGGLTLTVPPKAVLVLSLHE
jgi:alpha-N-arabinofuranosidase